MGVLDDYFAQHERELTARFARIRAAHSDSDVKGGANEQSIAELLRCHMADKRIVTNSSLLDNQDYRSDEVDVAVCNVFQPFLTGDTAQLLLIEGVDSVVQVKARLTTTELKRIVANAASVKQLQRVRQDGARALVHNDADLPHVIARCLHLSFCFESELTLQTAVGTLRELVAEVPLEHQPDAIYILDRGVLVNVRHNDGTMRMVPDELRGFCSSPSEAVLLGFVQTLFVLQPRIEYPFHPLTMYWKFGRPAT